MPRESSYVLDSYAVIGFLENETFADRIEALLFDAQKDRVALYLHAIHLGEVYYIALREKGQHLADLTYARIKALPINIIKQIDENLLKRACSFKAFFPISYADSFAAALAKTVNCPLLTGDPEFEPLEKADSIQIEWLTNL
ncbi:MAG: type II toxin-antitoxin system VapC family toxin [Desulfobacterales bacterium]